MWLKGGHEVLRCVCEQLEWSCEVSDGDPTTAFVSPFLTFPAMYHGLCPKRRAGQIFVANHTSMIDMIILGLWSSV